MAQYSTNERACTRACTCARARARTCVCVARACCVSSTATLPRVALTPLIFQGRYAMQQSAGGRV